MFNSDGNHKQFFWEEKLEDHNIEEFFDFRREVRTEKRE